jgi:hypothetical protein
MQRSRLIVKAGTAGVVACGLVLAAVAIWGGQAPPPALGPAIVVQVAGPSPPRAPEPDRVRGETCLPTGRQAGR